MDFRILFNFKPLLKTIIYFFFSFLYVFSFPVYSATSISTYGVINLAFILGLSIPIVVLSLFYSAKHLYKLRYFVLLTLSLMATVYSIAFIEESNSNLALAFSILYLTFVYFSLSTNDTNLIPAVTKISHCAVVISSIVLIVTTFFNLGHSQSIIWFFSGGVIVALIAVRIKCTTNDLISSITQMCLFWLPALYFSIVVFLSINQNIGNFWFMINVMICYVLYFLACCWNNTREDKTKTTEKTESFLPPLSQLSTDMSDSATNLPSQKQAYRNINKAIKAHSNDTFAFVVFKPINFQQVNKILGHKNSDILLLQLAYCLQKSVENNSSLINFNNSQVPVRIARLRGLHFLVVLHLKEKEKNQEILVDQLCHELTLAVPDAMSFKSFSLNFELTFGVSFMHETVSSLSQTVAHAEDALLTAENNQVVLSYFNKDEIIYSESHLLQMERLKEDIIQDNLYWYIQPQTRAADRKIVGFELLVQWHNENNVPIEFQGFIDTAEHSGEIYLLTKQMITRAFKLILKLQRVSNYEKVSIKLLSQYLLEPDLVSFIEKQIATYNVPAKYLIIELPEKIVLSASERAKNTIDELRSLNVNIAISDFSGSYESLRYIRKMSVHQVKVNCEAISEEADEPENAIITSLIDFTKKMDMPLIGTSINSQSTQQAFTLMGGELIQGEVVDLGVTSENIDTWVTTWNNLYNPS